MAGNDHGRLTRSVRSRGGWGTARPKGPMAGAVGRDSTPPLRGCQETSLTRA